MLSAGLGALAACAQPPSRPAPQTPSPDAPLRFGVGDRLTLRTGAADARAWRPLADRARQLGIPLDYLEIWLPRGWDESWLPRSELQALERRGTVPILVHYFFGDAVSRERIEAERQDWYASVERLARIAAPLASVLIVLEPEFNNEPPPGETRAVEWSGLTAAFRGAMRRIRAIAPRAQLGICAGDFYPDRDLGRLASLASEIDFTAFQEMRAASDPDRHRPDYLHVGAWATRYARYLRETFGKPVLLAYVAVSSYGGWEAEQAFAVSDLTRHRDELRRAGVFGVVYFQLQDDPEHRGYFGPAERNFGLIDARGRVKPALRAFLELAATGRRIGPSNDSSLRSTLR